MNSKEIVGLKYTDSTEYACRGCMYKHPAIIGTDAMIVLREDACPEGIFLACYCGEPLDKEGAAEQDVEGERYRGGAYYLPTLPAPRNAEEYKIQKVRD